MRLSPLVLTLLALMSGPVVAQNTGSPHYGRVTHMGGDEFHMQLPGLRPNRSGEIFNLPDPIFNVSGRQGDYTVRASGGDASLPVLQAWLPELCAVMQRSVASATYRARGNRRIAEVTCR